MRAASDPSAYQRERAAAMEAARQVAPLIRRQAGQARSDDTREKAHHDFVTETDREAQRLIVSHLTEIFPDYAVLAEEGAAEALAETADGHRWIIDPIDGTTNFMHGVPPYAVSVALQRGDEVVLGVVLEVASGELFTAVRGGGCYLGERRVRVSRTRALGDALLATGFPYRRLEHMEAYLGVLGRFLKKARGIRRHGAASIDLAYVACGRFDGFFETGLRPWDVAAGTLLVEEAGGHVTDYHGTPNPLFRSQILATNGLLHASMLEGLASMQAVRS